MRVSPARRARVEAASPAVEAPPVRPASPRRARGDEIAKIEHDPINEQVVLAAGFVSREARAKLVRILTVDCFFVPKHKAAFESLAELDRRGLLYDPATVRQISGGGVDTNYVDALIEARPCAPPNLAHHVEFLLWDRRRVEAEAPINALLAALRDSTTEPEKVRALARAVGGAFEGRSSLRFLRDAETVIAEMERDLDDSARRFREGNPCYPYGLPGFDFYGDGAPRLVPGMAPQQLTLVVGASGAGKTTFTNQMVLAQIEQGRRVLHGAWEQDAKTNLRLLAAFSLGFPRTRLFTGNMTDEELDALKAEGRRIGGLVKFFDLPFDRVRGEQKVKSLNEKNLDTVHEHVEMAGCDVAIFDLFHQALVETRPEDEKRALDKMQGIAKGTRAHLVLLHHVNKADLAARADRRPTRDAIKGGTHWINAFDTIVGLHIPGVWKNIPMDTLEAHILKQRYGPWPLAVEFDYDPATGLVSNGRDFEVRHADEESPMDPFLDGRKDGKKEGGRRGGR